MVIYERSPLLTSLRIARTNHIPSNRTRGMLDSEFDFQLLVYFVFSPSRVLSAYSLNKPQRCKKRRAETRKSLQNKGARSFFWAAA